MEEYEKKFIRVCKRNRIRLDKDETGCPVSRPRGKKKKRWFYMCPWSDEQSAIVITAPTVQRKKALKKQAKNVKCEVFVDGEQEAILLFPIKSTKIMAKTMGLVKKKATAKQKEWAKQLGKRKDS